MCVPKHQVVQLEWRTGLRCHKVSWSRPRGSKFARTSDPIRCCLSLIPPPTPGCTDAFPQIPPLNGCPQASQYDIPIYITETGIADRSDANRAFMIDQYMQAVSQP
jgi:hypothetical protein